MPESGIQLTPQPELLTNDELMRIARVFVQHGVQKIRLTGGEPTVRRNLVDIVARLRAELGAPDEAADKGSAVAAAGAASAAGPSQAHGLHTIGMTSNGVALQRILPDLKRAGLTHINISLDTLQPHRFASMSRRNAELFSAVWGSIDTALSLGFASVKINVVAMAGINDDELVPFVALTQHMPLQVRFIEFMPFPGNDFRASSVLGYREMVSRIQGAYPTFEPLQASKGETAKIWRVPGHAGSVGFITTMTDEFCGSCDRLRLTSDGHLKVCLHGREEYNLRDILRRENSTDEDIAQAIGAAVKRKHSALGGAKGAMALIRRSAVEQGTGATGSAEAAEPEAASRATPGAAAGPQVRMGQREMIRIGG
jgi:molybdenum cofactor biosynthesis enzyme MoaA